MQQMRRLHATGRGGEIDICARCCTTIPHPALVAGSLLLHGKTVRRLLPGGGAHDVSGEAARAPAASAATNFVMATYTLRREQFVPRPLEEVFAFFSDAANLQKITPLG